MTEREMPKQLTPDQLKALRVYAAKYGRIWKSSLHEAWMTGNYRGFEDSHLLQQIRNQFGPTWLVRFRFGPNSGPGKGDDLKECLNCGDDISNNTHPNAVPDFCDKRCEDAYYGED